MTNPRQTLLADLSVSSKFIPTAKAIVSLLREKHSEDVFVPECKDGPTQSTGHFRMDAWAMNRSWANPCISAYEVKVSRSDFLNDNKWRSYLPYCNQLSFVCPRNLIGLTELPVDVGLYYVASTGTRLVTARKPVWRDVVIPDSVWRYILMCRAVIKGEEAAEGRNADYWREWIETKEEDRKLGYRCSTAIAQHVSKVDSDNKRLKEKMAEYDDVRKLLIGLGWNEPDKEPWLSADRVKHKIASLSQVVPPWVPREMERLEEALKQMRSSIAVIQAGGKLE